MPFTARTFQARHNKTLGNRVAKRGAQIANAMLKRGVPEGEAIATANARANRTPLNATATPPTPKKVRLGRRRK